MLLVYSLMTAPQTCALINAFFKNKNNTKDK
jgi:hypothetical protein